MKEIIKSGVKPQKPNPEKAAFVLWVRFKNNSADSKGRVFYSYHTSYDCELKKVIINDVNALNKLKKLIDFVWVGKYKTACIYHKETNTQLYKWINDKLVQEAPYKITYINNSVKIIPL